MKTIVVSAVNLNVGGTLTILKDCLSYLSTLNQDKNYRIVALVYDKNLCLYPHIEYIETQWPKKRWINRLWYEYISMKRISKKLAPVDLWFSLHDTTPSVYAKRRAVYCHNSFAFYEWKINDWIFAPKIAAFALFTKYIYRTNIHKNDYLVVQQKWFREGMNQLFSFDKKRIIVAPPQSGGDKNIPEQKPGHRPSYSFIFAGSPNSHKNFEIICEAAEILERNKSIGGSFEVFITVHGDENKYAEWLYKKWSKKTPSIRFIGFLPKEELEFYYARCDCLIYPSKIESWGLPISEFRRYNKPMLLADLPYAHETAEGGQQVAFFDPAQPKALARQMKRLIQGDDDFLEAVPQTRISPPKASSWAELFKILLT